MVLVLDTSRNTHLLFITPSRTNGRFIVSRGRVERDPRCHRRTCLLSHRARSPYHSPLRTHCPFPGVTFTRFRTRHLAVPELFEVWALAEWSKFRLYPGSFISSAQLTLPLPHLPSEPSRMSPLVFLHSPRFLYTVPAVSTRFFQHGNTRQHLTELVSTGSTGGTSRMLAYVYAPEPATNVIHESHHEEQDKGWIHSQEYVDIIYHPNHRRPCKIMLMDDKER